MTKTADASLVEAMACLERALSSLGRPHMLIGGLAVIARGVARNTDDVDATVWAADLDVKDLVRALSEEGRMNDCRTWYTLSFTGSPRKSYQELAMKS